MHLTWRSKCAQIFLVTRRCVTNNVSGNGIKSSEAAGSTTSQEFEIPNRVQRSPTDILYALASTVGRDPTAPHYKYHDDPYLIPVTNAAKRTYAIAQEAGRNAAKWIKEEHRTLFLHQEAAPPVKEFMPKMVFTEDSNVDDISLRQLIMQSEVSDAVLVYNLMKQKGIELSADLRQSLLELLCFYNHSDQLLRENIEERWFQEHNAAREVLRKSWKDGDLAEQIFAEIEPKGPAAYAALIRGMAKYNQAERAYTLLQEATEKQIELDINTFNGVIGVINFIRDTSDERWELCQQILQQISQQQIKPNLGTMNALLEVIKTFGNHKFARNCALRVLAEFKKLDVEPSLGSYYYLLTIFCRDRAPPSHIIVDIINEIKGKHFTITHPKDTYFFTTAMDVCRNHLHDGQLAKQINEILHTGQNYNLIGDSYKETVYYRHYFALLCQTETLDEFMQTYDLLVPNVYIPEPGIMEEILKAVQINGAIELLPRLWSDIVISDNTRRESILMRLLQIMAESQANSQTSSQADFAEQLATIAYDIYKKIEDPGGRQKLSFTGQMIGDILLVLARASDFEKAIEVFTNIEKNQHRIPGTPSEACLLEFVDMCIAHRAPTQALLTLQYAVDNNMEYLPMAKKINDGFTLNEVHLSKLKSLIGNTNL